jgi:hypothetical protein
MRRPSRVLDAFARAVEACALLKPRRMSRPSRSWFVVLTLVLALSFTASASADPSPTATATVELSGVVTDKVTGAPVAGVLVHVAGAEGVVRDATTDARGRYRVTVGEGVYKVLFVYGMSQTMVSVQLQAGKGGTLDAKIDSGSGETIVVKDKIVPKVMPKAKNYAASKAPPYSEKVILADTWTRAWLLLDIDERGDVTRFKWLKRPGYDLEKLTTAEVWKIKFEPAIGPDGKPMRVRMVWKFEWPAVGWLNLMNDATRSYSPSGVTFIQGDKASDFRAHHPFEYIPCTGESTANLDSYYPITRDCSTYDLKTADTEQWIVRGAPTAELTATYDQQSVAFTKVGPMQRSKLVPALATSASTVALAAVSVLAYYHRKGLAELNSPDQNPEPCFGDCAVARDAEHAKRAVEIERYRKYTIGLGAATVAVGCASAFLWSRAIESRKQRMPSISFEHAPGGGSVSLGFGF